MRYVVCVLASLFAAGVCGAAPVFVVNAGANTVSFNKAEFPSDFELGGTASASLSPHLSAVGSAFYGVGYSYLRGTVGARVTATDTNNPRFSVGFGAEYQGTSEADKRPQEWCAVVAIGYKPLPSLPKLVVGASGAYGFDSDSAMLLLAARYQITSF